MKKIINKIPIILDTDIGFDIDDSWALAFLLKCPELDVKLVTTTSDNTLIKTKLVAKYLELAGRDDIPIGIGPQENDEKGFLFEWIEDYDISQYPSVVYENGAEAICSTILNSSLPITLIAIGPLGTVSKALKLNSHITKKSRFIGMHGSIRIGYLGGRPSREYNVIRNIHACKHVFSASWEKTITPLDTCGSVVIKGELFKKVMNSDNETVRLIKEHSEIWNQKSKIVIPEGQTSTLYDTAAIYLGFSENLMKIEELPIEVTTRGQTKISEKGNLIRCATAWKDLDEFKELLVNRLVS